MSLIIIAAISENNVIGKDGKVPWRITKEDKAKYRGDIDRFRDLTIDHPVIMGRKTYESIPPRYRPLPRRLNIVLSRSKDFLDEGVADVRSVEEALKICDDYFIGGINEGSYVIGGAEIYNIFLPLASRMEITRIHRHFEGDAFFPEVNWDEWQKKGEEPREGYSFLTYVRKS